MMPDTLPSPSDGRLLHAYAELERVRIMLRLYRSPATQKELAAELGLNSGVISKQMKVLEDADLVGRPRSHGAYGLVAPRETWAVLRSISNLAAAINTARADADDQWSQEVQRAAMQPAANDDLRTDSG
jgi:predicted transcriptional regulator